MFNLNTFVKIIICSLFLTSFAGLHSCKSENSTKTEVEAKKKKAKAKKANGNKSKSGKKVKGKVKNIKSVQFANLMSRPNTVILDVRTPEEVKKGKIKGAKVIDFKAKDFTAKIKKLDKSKRYLVYCQGGNRSSKAATKMANIGIKQVFNLEGGYSAWKKIQAKPKKGSKKKTEPKN